MSVVLNAPAVFRFTGPSNPERHLKAAKLLGADVSAVNLEDAGSLLADTIVGLIRQLGLPNGLRGVGYTPDDVEALVGGAIPQQRVLGLSPRVAGEEELRRLFLDSMTLW
jgi:hydroxyacid-oxoacid transhydrogenase